jgi:hypothetical protein
MKHNNSQHFSISGSILVTRFQVFMVVKIDIVVIWAMTPCSNVSHRYPPTKLHGIITQRTILKNKHLPLEYMLFLDT